MDSKEKFSIGTAIRNARMARQMSIKELVKQTHVSEQFLISIESDQYLRLPAKIYSMSLTQDVLEYLKFETSEKEKILQILEADLNKVEQEKYELLKNENYTSKISKFSMEGQVQPPSTLTPPSFPPIPPTPSFSSSDSASPSSSSTPSPTPLHKPKQQVKEVVETSQPIQSPAEESENSNFFMKVMISSLVGISLLVLFILLWFFVIQPKGIAIDTLEKESTQKRLQVFSLYGRSQTFEMAEGDQLRIFFSNTIATLSFKTIADNQLIFATSEGVNYSFDLHSRHFVNLDDNEENDILLKYQKRSGDIAVVFVENLLFNEAKVNYEKVWNNQEHVLIGRNYTLLENQIKVPIIIYVKALTLPVHLSYNVDGRRQNTVNLVTGSSLIISANEHLEIQIGNYLSSALIINNTPINLFLEKYSRYSTTKIIKWLPDYDNETLFDLVVTDYVN